MSHKRKGIQDPPCANNQGMYCPEPISIILGALLVAVLAISPIAAVEDLTRCNAADDRVCDNTCRSTNACGDDSEIGGYCSSKTPQLFGPLAGHVVRMCTCQCAPAVPAGLQDGPDGIDPLGSKQVFLDIFVVPMATFWAITDDIEPFVKNK